MRDAAFPERLVLQCPFASPPPRGSMAIIALLQPQWLGWCLGSKLNCKQA